MSGATAKGGFNWNAKKYRKGLERSLAIVFAKVGNHIDAKVVASISIDQEFRRTESGTMVGLWPADYGDPPHTLTGRLRQSIANVRTNEDGKIGTRIGTNVIYGRVHEMGEEGNLDGHGDHPFLKPAMSSSSDYVMEQIRAAGKRAERRAAKARAKAGGE